MKLLSFVLTALILFGPSFSVADEWYPSGYGAEDPTTNRWPRGAARLRGAPFDFATHAVEPVLSLTKGSGRMEPHHTSTVQ